MGAGIWILFALRRPASRNNAWDCTNYHHGNTGLILPGPAAPLQNVSTVQPPDLQGKQNCSQGPG
jgi:hypothetical protein